jgi:hypothetical protein
VSRSPSGPAPRGGGCSVGAAPTSGTAGARGGAAAAAATWAGRCSGGTVTDCPVRNQLSSASANCWAVWKRCSSSRAIPLETMEQKAGSRSGTIVLGSILELSLGRFPVNSGGLLHLFRRHESPFAHLRLCQTLSVSSPLPYAAFSYLLMVAALVRVVFPVRLQSAKGFTHKSLPVCL